MRKVLSEKLRKVVSYSSKRYKAVAVSARKAVVVKDILQFSTEKTPVGRTEFRLRRDAENLYLEVSCFEPDPSLIRAENSQNGMGIWKGDMIEIFFGAVEPVPWLLQLGVGAGGGRFDGRGDYDLWEASTSRDSVGWYADIRIPLVLLRLHNLSLGFNLCRQAVVRQEFSSWSELEHKFHEPENFGDLLFCDYDTAFFAKTGIPCTGKLSRNEFEKKITEFFIPAEKVLHGPFLSNPSSNSMTVSWETAGMSGAILEYRKKGRGEWLSLPVSHKNGVLRRNERFHSIHLCGLENGTDYEYRLANWSPLLDKRETFPAGKPFSFRTLDTKKKEFTFALCSDIHSDTHVLKKFMRMPFVKETDFFVNLGDMLSCMCGPDSFYEGFLDIQTELYARKKPLVFVRGNHEQIGIFSADFTRMMNHPSGKTYYAFRHGDICFLVLDAGNDHADDADGIYRNADMIMEERNWLETVVKSEIFQTAVFRVALLHMPPYNDQYDSRAGMLLLEGVFEKVPLHLLIGGHVHRYFRMNPFSGECTAENKTARMKNTPVLPFTVAANDTDTVLLVKASPDSLKIRVVKADGKPADEFTILPDASLAGSGKKTK